MTTASQDQPFVIAVDSGGTHTRVGCFALDGAELATAHGAGGSPFHNPGTSAANVARAVDECMASKNLRAENAVALAAGIAEIVPGVAADDPVNAWADEYFSGLPTNCARVIVNDAIAAHRGALLGRPGVIVVAGTGSMVLAIDEAGNEIENRRFDHYAGAARHLVMEAMQLILTGHAGPEDAAFVAEVLDYWGAADIAELRETVLGLQRLERDDRLRRYGLLAPAVAENVDSSPLADQVVRTLAERTARAVALVAPAVAGAPVPVALAGAVAMHPVFRSRLQRELDTQPGTPTVLAETALDPLHGAALLALRAAGVPLENGLLRRLRQE